MGISGKLFAYCLLSVFWLSSLQGVRSCGCRHRLAWVVRSPRFASRFRLIDFRLKKKGEKQKQSMPVSWASFLRFHQSEGAYLPLYISHLRFSFLASKRSVWTGLLLCKNRLPVRIQQEYVARETQKITLRPSALPPLHQTACRTMQDVSLRDHRGAACVRYLVYLVYIITSSPNVRNVCILICVTIDPYILGQNGMTQWRDVIMATRNPGSTTIPASALTAPRQRGSGGAFDRYRRRTAVVLHGLDLPEAEQCRK